jgi:hypothetical protein
MCLASGLLLAGAAAYFAGALSSATAVDYRELVAAAQSSDDLPGSGGGSGGAGGSAGLLAAARAAMASEGDLQQHQRQLSDIEEEGSMLGDDGGLESGTAGRASPDRPLLPPGAFRSSSS